MIEEVHEDLHRETKKIRVEFQGAGTSAGTLEFNPYFKNKHNGTQYTKNTQKTTFFHF